MDFELCESMGMSYSRFLKLPEWEKKGWRCYVLVKGKRAEKMHKEAERKANQPRHTPKVR